MRGLSLVFLIGCADPGPAQTLVAVENGAAETVSVTLASDDGLESFPDLAPGTSSESRAVAWTTLTGITVTIDAGAAESGSVDLLEGGENLVIVGTGAPTVKVEEPADVPDAGGGW
jgi:hypothetical protein